MTAWQDRLAAVKKTSYSFAAVRTEVKNALLRRMQDELLRRTQDIMHANEQDMQEAGRRGLSSAMLDRLALNRGRIEDLARSLDTIIGLDDPIGAALDEWVRPGGLTIRKVRVPLGVVCVVYESRPNVTIDAAALCIKSGNCCILRGGSEALHSNRALAACIARAAEAAGTPGPISLFIDDTSHDLLYDILTMDRYIDVVIPRGGEDMISAIRSRSRIPVLSHGSGICHTYVDARADLEIAQRVCLNAKVQRPGVCNAMETLLVHRHTAEAFLPPMAQEYIRNGVELRGCPDTCAILGRNGVRVIPATEQDWGAEYLALILAVRVVPSLNAAIDHINTWGSHHSDAIITEDPAAAERFCTEVDSAAVFVNASTRLHDGGVFGFGAEIGISTSKLHARGTMGLRELTSSKYLVSGRGAVRE
jgi:glutamate-5-semialdehyde dehydrogenase